MRILYSAVGPLVVLLIWQGLSQLGVVSAILLPPPTEVFAVYFDVQEAANLAEGVGLTFLRAISGFALGAIVGVGIGVILGWWRPIYNTVEFLIEFFRSLPAAAMLPPFMLAFGIGEVSKVLMVAFSCALVVVVHTAAGVRDRNPTRVLVGKLQGATQIQIFWKIIVPEVLGSVATALRISVSLALIVTIVAEMLISTGSGLGQIILDRQNNFQIAEMYAGIILAGFLGYALNKTISTVADSFIHWEGK